MAREALAPYLWSISDVFKHVYSVPVYQRPYSWDRPQINMLLDDIFDAYKLPSTEREEGYFIGNIFIHDRNEKLKGLIQQYEIIDGQQRMTTISLLLLSLYSRAISMEVSESDPIFVNIKSSLWKYINRKYDKKHRVVSLNSIEKNSFENLFDYCFDNPKKVLGYCENYDSNNSFEKRVMENYITVSARIDKEFTTLDDLLNFSDFLLNYVQVIAIDSTCSISKAFSIFESINSKGKPLEEIDKIKTYIFSELDESSYDYYLQLWGELIITTNDQLYDYLYNYIKAYISFYRQSINVENFKALSKEEIPAFFQKSNIAEGLMALLDDMKKKVCYYTLLGDVDKAYKKINNHEFHFYFKLFNQINYKHPKPLFLRCIEEYDSGKMKKQDLVSIIRETVKFMVEFLTITDRDSKDAITMFSVIMNDIYARQKVDKKVVINVIANELVSKAVTRERVKNALTDMDAYEQNNKIAVALLALYESCDIDKNDKAKISYDKAYTLLNDYGETFSLDHLLVQTPEKDSKFQYYKDENDRLILKKGHDFDTVVATPGMDYEQFTRNVLNRIGNLRLWYSDENSSRKNSVIQLNKYAGFTTYKKIKSRGKKIVNTLVEYCLPMPEYDPRIKVISNSRENVLPNMKKMLEYGLLNIGDKLYITISPNESEATLIDANTVNFKGKDIKISEWGCKVSGWKSANIYRIAAVVGEDETLQQKRIKYTINHNEEALG